MTVAPFREEEQRGKLEEWFQRAGGRTQSARGEWRWRGWLSPRSRREGRTPGPRGRRCRHMGWSDWRCRKVSSVSTWEWKWYQGTVPAIQGHFNNSRTWSRASPHSRDSISHFAVREPPSHPTQWKCRSLSSPWPHQCCYCSATGSCDGDPTKNLDNNRDDRRVCKYSPWIRRMSSCQTSSYTPAHQRGNIPHQCRSMICRWPGGSISLCQCSGVLPSSLS